MSDDAPLNGDLAQTASMDTNSLDWTASPSGTVWRKRMHRVGPAESGQVTSVVRYEANSRFPTHPHPEGEEILVLEGVFSDEHGDWPAGTYLLNPEGFSHAPFSDPGCVLFVKLRQYPGLDREQLQLPTGDIIWQDTTEPGRQHKPLYQQQGFEDHMRLERWEPGTDTCELEWPDGLELFVISGELNDEEQCLPAYSWLRLPPGSRRHLHSRTGCELYIKEGGFAYLRGA